jgi:hypothetical protein
VAKDKKRIAKPMKGNLMMVGLGVYRIKGRESWELGNAYAGYKKARVTVCLLRQKQREEKVDSTIEYNMNVHYLNSKGRLMMRVYREFDFVAPSDSADDTKTTFLMIDAGSKTPRIWFSYKNRDGDYRCNIFGDSHSFDEKSSGLLPEVRERSTYINLAQDPIHPDYHQTLGGQDW